MAKERITINPFGRAKLNNSEYANFMSEVRKLADVAGYDKLGIDQAELVEFDTLVKQLVDIGLQTAAKSQTLSLTQLNHQRGSIETFILMTTRYAQDLPIDNLALAAQNLYLQLKPYVGMQDASLTQESAQVNSLLALLAEPQNAAYAATLGLTTVIAKLKTVEATFEAQYNSRAQSQVDNPYVNTRPLRASIDQLYDAMTLMAQAKILTSPSDAGRLFVKSLNKLIDDTQRLYHTRITAEATRKKKAEGETAEA